MGDAPIYGNFHRENDPLSIGWNGPPHVQTTHTRGKNISISNYQLNCSFLAKHKMVGIMLQIIGIQNYCNHSM